MPANVSPDPMEPITVRLPGSVCRLLRSEVTDDLSLSDVVRHRLNIEAVEPLFNPTPRKRKSDVVGGVSRADPLLIRQLAAIGSNVNQVARTLNRHVVAGTSVSGIELLSALASIERHLCQLTSSAEATPKPSQGRE